MRAHVTWMDSDVEEFEYRGGNAIERLRQNENFVLRDRAEFVRRDEEMIYFVQKSAPDRRSLSRLLAENLRATNRYLDSRYGRKKPKKK
jgi:hypothetical protein